MDFEQYVVARRTRLIEHAVELGVADGDAPALVDRVLDAERSGIARSDDPDPEVREALRSAALGRPWQPRRSRTATAAVVALVVLVGLAVAAVVRQVDREPEPTPVVPVTFALDLEGATATLTEAGYRVESREVVRCETPRQVVGTEPAPGEEAAEGSTVTVTVATPPGLSCPLGGGFRADVWEFLRWVADLGPAPSLVDRPTVVITDGTGTRSQRIGRAELDRRVGDDDLLGALRDEVTRVAATASGFPELTVRNGITPPPCGAPAPDANAGLLTIRFDLDATVFGDDPCPLSGYLVPDGDRIGTVVLVLPPGAGGPA